MPTTRIFGMAKSSLNLRGAKRPKVELDYLRLVYACQRFPGSHAYLVVTDVAMQRAAEAWAAKYEAVGVVRVRVVPAELITTELRAEKALNATGMVALLTGGGTKSDTVASLGEAVGEEYLLQLLLASGLYPGLRVEDGHSIRRKMPRQELPLKINWDFYAEYDGPLPALSPSTQPTGG